MLLIYLTLVSLNPKINQPLSAHKKLYLTGRDLVQVFQLKKHWSFYNYSEYAKNSSRLGSLRTLFGFFKLKPFVRSVRENFLSRYRLNNLSKTLNIIVSSSKQASPAFLQQFLHPTLIKWVSSEFLLWRSFSLIFSLSLSRKFNAYKFTLFKHKIYSYTTPKQLTRSSVFVKTSSPLSKAKDFRVCFRDEYQSPWLKSDNWHTFSTYNWKHVN